MSKRKSKTGLAIALFALAWVGVGATLVLLAPDEEPATRPAAATEDDSPPATEPRELVVSTTRGTDGVSTPEGPLHASLMEGTMAASPMMATVLSDANCAPDAQGLSHCRNELRMADGSALTVRHVHRMAEVPCLSPGEEVLVVPA